METHNTDKESGELGLVGASTGELGADEAADFGHSFSQIVAGTKISGGTLVDNAAGLMAEDVQTYLKGCEQILTAAIAVSLQQIMEGKAPQGEMALTACQTLMKELPEYAKSIFTLSNKVINNDLKDTGST
jgi:hypothetical protein